MWYNRIVKRMGEIQKRRKGLIMRKNCKTFEQWIESMYQDFCVKGSRTKHLHCEIYRSHNTVSCCICNTRKSHSAYERVKLIGGFDNSRKKAIALAWASYCNIDIPEFKKPTYIKDIEYGDIFTDIKGKKWIKTGYNPRTNRFMSIPLSGSIFYLESLGTEMVFLPR